MSTDEDSGGVTPVFHPLRHKDFLECLGCGKVVTHWGRIESAMVTIRACGNRNCQELVTAWTRKQLSLPSDAK